MLFCHNVIITEVHVQSRVLLTWLMVCSLPSFVQRNSQQNRRRGSHWKEPKQINLFLKIMRHFWKRVTSKSESCKMVTANGGSERVTTFRSHALPTNSGKLAVPSIHSIRLFGPLGEEFRRRRDAVKQCFIWENICWVKIMNFEQNWVTIFSGACNRTILTYNSALNWHAIASVTVPGHWVKIVSRPLSGNTGHEQNLWVVVTVQAAIVCPLCTLVLITLYCNFNQSKLWDKVDCIDVSLLYTHTYSCQT